MSSRSRRRKRSHAVFGDGQVTSPQARPTAHLFPGPVRTTSFPLPSRFNASLIIVFIRVVCICPLSPSFSCMASSHTSVHSRNNNNQHVPEKINLTALRGATSAFNTTSSRDAGSQLVKSRIQAMGTAILPDTSHHRHHNDSAPSDADSNPPPEVGSVRDKIGKFAVTSPASSPLYNSQNHVNSVPDPGRKDLKSPVQSPIPQQIAARLATERSPVRDERLSFLAQHKISRPSSPLSSDNGWMKARQDADMPAPRPIRSSTGPSPVLQKLLQEDVREAPPLPRKPPSFPGSQ